MASFQIPMPDPMICKGNLEENWKTFKEDWQDYFTATELKNKDKETQVATLRTAMGATCKKRLKNLSLTEDERKDPDAILEKLTAHFTPARNVLYDRFLFFEATQQPNETIDQFVLRLGQLAAPCKFDNKEDDMIMTRLALGCQDRAARARLFRQKGADIDLKKAIESLQIDEAAARQLKRVGEASNEQQINFARRRNQPKQDKKYKSHKTSTSTTKKKEDSHRKKEDDGCFFCGGQHAKGRSNCPAYGRKCNNCKRLHHFSKVCQQRRVHHFEEEIETEEEEEDENQSSDTSDEDCFMITKDLGSVSTGGKNWTATMKLNGLDTICRLDSGSDCNVMSYTTCCQILQDGKPKLQKSRTKLKFYDGTTLIPRGQYTFDCLHNDQEWKLKFQIVEAQQQPLISGDTCKEMGLLILNVDVNSVAQVDDVVSAYNDVFEGLGSLPGEYHIAIDKTVTPVKNQARKVAVAIKPELKAKLQDLEEKHFADDYLIMVVVTQMRKLQLIMTET